jgi:ketosteroid isomerase-like protein
MSRVYQFFCLALILGIALPMSAQAAGGDEADIRSAIKSQSDAWNRSDIPGFMQVYEDTPETTFIGSSTLRKGVQPIRQRYELTYSSPALMGKLTFSDIEVHVLHPSCGKAEFAVVTGKFHLDRAKVEGQKDEGIFSLVWRKGPKGWKVILDHTSQ